MSNVTPAPAAGSASTSATGSANTVVINNGNSTATSDPLAEHNKSSTIIAASTVVGFLFLGITAILLFLKITRHLRDSRDKKRFEEWNAAEHGGHHPKGRHFGSRRIRGKNAFDIIEDDEGIPA